MLIIISKFTRKELEYWFIFVAKKVRTKDYLSRTESALGKKKTKKSSSQNYKGVSA
jgi:hypothetical protein